MKEENDYINPEPAPKAMKFWERLVSINALDELGFKEWAFHPDMVFNAPAKWWGDKGKRNTPHEGLDLCLYRTSDGQIRHLDERTKIPVLFEGEVIKTGDDFLGESVFICHNIYNSQGEQLLTAYGHLKLADGIHPGKVLGEGDLLGNIADIGERKTKILPHAHISVAWKSRSSSYEELWWDSIADPSVVTLLNPLGIIECRYSVVDSI